MLYYIRIDNRNIYVSKEIYKLYCKGQRKERHFRESDIHNRTFSYNALDTEDLNGCDLFQDTRSKSVEEQAEEALERSLLLKAMKGLDPRERDMIRRIYCYDQSLRQISRETGVPVTTLHYRHGKILRKLRSLMEQRQEE